MSYCHRITCDKAKEIKSFTNYGNIYKVIKVQGGGKMDSHIFEFKNTFCVLKEYCLTSKSERW